MSVGDNLEYEYVILLISKTISIFKSILFPQGLQYLIFKKKTMYK